MKKLRQSIWACALASLMMIGTLVTSNETYADLKDGLVSVWKFDEGKGDVAHDSIGNNDGIIDSLEQNPSHVYYDEGVFTVKLTVSNATSSYEHVKANFIQVAAPKPDLSATLPSLGLQHVVALST